MAEWRNRSGIPLAGSQWLEAHHRAKRPERQAFAASLAALGPRRIVDLGCGTGLWLELLNDLMPTDCEFVGLDADASSLSEARTRSKSWDRYVSFEEVDLVVDFDRSIGADLVLMFNVANYLPNFESIAELLLRNGSTVSIRQYDGNSLRFGPIETQDRRIIEDSLLASVGPSDQFKHYGLDDVYSFAARCSSNSRRLQFETFSRTAPFPDDFVDYWLATLEWTDRHLSDFASSRLKNWRELQAKDSWSACYFFEVDFTALLS